MNESINQQPDAAVDTASTNGKRKKLIAAVLGVFLVSGIVYAGYWAMVARFAESTEDAYVSGNVVQVTPQIAGTVVAIKANDTDFVSAGKALVELDRSDADVALQESEAQLGQTVRSVRNLFAQTAQLQATVAGRKVDVARAKADLEHREHLASSGAIAAEELQHARDTVRSAESALRAASERLAGHRALIDHSTVATNPRVAKAAASVRAAWLDYQRAVLPAPVSGIVAKRNVQVGQRVSPGRSLMAIVPLDQVWVDANFKERQLENLRVGQPVRLVADANGFTYHGKVAGLGAGTGSAFALLPAQNATGNWIKVVQRLPVRIALSAQELKAHPLSIGLSMEVEVDTHHRSGHQLRQVASTGQEDRTSVFARQEHASSDLIARIIERNGGGSGINGSEHLALLRPATLRQPDSDGGAARDTQSAR